MPDNEQPPIYPADGSPTVIPDPKAWAEHSDEQVKTNISGIKAARDALQRNSVEEQPDTPTTKAQDDSDQPPAEDQ